MTTETLPDWSDVHSAEVEETATASVYHFPASSWLGHTIEAGVYLESSLRYGRAKAYTTRALRNATMHSRQSLDVYLEQLHAGTAAAVMWPTHHLVTTSRLSDDVDRLVRRLLEEAASTVLAADAVRLRSDYLPQMFEDPDPQAIAVEWVERLGRLSSVEDHLHELPWTQDD